MTPLQGVARADVELPYYGGVTRNLEHSPCGGVLGPGDAEELRVQSATGEMQHSDLPAVGPSTQSLVEVPLHHSRLESRKVSVDNHPDDSSNGSCDGGFEMVNTPMTEGQSSHE